MESDNINFFTVTPMSQRISLEPGQVYEGYIKLINPADAKTDFDYKIEVSPYTVVGQDYNADFEAESQWTQIADWITVAEPTGTVKPNNVKEIHFTITVPNDVPAGGQYAAIVVSHDPQSEVGEGNNMAVKDIFEMASLIYADVAGETRHEGEILGNDIPGFSTTVPISLGAMFDNHGNIHETATIVISAKDVFSGQEILPTPEDDGKYTEIVIPDTTRYVSRDLSNLPMLGVVHVEQTIYYNGHYSQQAKDVFICPLWFIILVLITVCAIIGVIVHKVRKHKKHRARVEAL